MDGNPVLQDFRGGFGTLFALTGAAFGREHRMENSGTISRSGLINIGGVFVGVSQAANGYAVESPQVVIKYQQRM